MQTMPQPDPLGKYFAGSLGTHVAIVGLLVLSGMWKLSTTSWGGPNLSSGSVPVAMVKTIPIPRNDAPENPLANDSEANVPQAPSPVKRVAEVKAPDLKAIPIPDKMTRKVSPKALPPVVFRPAQEYKTNQVYSQAPQAMSSKLYGTQGASGVDLGPASVFGDRFGDYANLLRDAIASKWNTADIRTTPAQFASVTFTIARNGSVSNVTVTHPSGSFLLDTSAKRAVLDAVIPPLPAKFDRSEATVEMKFQVKQ